MNTKRNRRRGKNHQREVAKLLDGLNIGIVGGADVLTEFFTVECKSRQSFVGQKWYEQAVEANKKFGKIPIVVVHISGKRYENDLVLIKLSDFIDIASAFRALRLTDFEDMLCGKCCH